LGGGKDLRAGSGDDVPNAFNICHYITVTKPNHTKSFATQKAITSGISPLLFWVKMLAAIQLDNQFCCVRNKINYVGSDWRLAPKANAV
jgi:hypothetical protein